MPLPTGGDIAWPPTDPVVQHALADWDAWYSSDPDRLERRYLNRGAYDLPENRPAQMRGGVVGRLARWFWGQPNPDGGKREKLHVPLAGDIARTSSDLLFSEPPKLRADNPDTQTRIEDLIAGGLHATLLEGGEVTAALGGGYLRLVWDEDVSDRPWIDAVPADAAVPDFVHGRLRAVTFWRVLEEDGQTVWRHLERHERGIIRHGLYEGSRGTLGRPVPLQDREETAPLAAEIDAGEDGITTGAPDHLTAVYVPNVRPARAWRHIPSVRGWGQSDFQGIEGLMDALDETYSSWMRDIQNGKGRIVVAKSMLDSLGPGQGAAWNEERRIYTGLNMLPRPGDPDPLTVVQFEIRVEEHSRTCAELVEQAVRQAGYSPATFGDSGDGTAVTATEIKARQGRSMTTRARKAVYWAPGIADIVEALLAVEAGPRFRLGGTVERPTVEFQDSVSESPKELAETVELVARAQAASRETLVGMLHPDWEEEQIQAEAARIADETALADPMLTGGEGFGGPAEE